MSPHQKLASFRNPILLVPFKMSNLHTYRLMAKRSITISNIIREYYEEIISSLKKELGNDYQISHEKIEEEPDECLYEIKIKDAYQQTYYIHLDWEATPEQELNVAVSKSKQLSHYIKKKLGIVSKNSSSSMYEEQFIASINKVVNRVLVSCAT